MSDPDNPRKAAYKVAFNAYIFGPKMDRVRRPSLPTSDAYPQLADPPMQATAGAAVALLKICSSAPADRRHRTHGLLVKVSHDDTIREPALPFKVTSIRSHRNNECFESLAGWSEPEKERVRTEMAVRATSHPNQVAIFFSLAASEICPALTAYSMRDIVRPESPVEFGPDWEDVARHHASDCFKDNPYESPEALMGGCRHKEAINAFLTPYFEALTLAGISALSIYSPLGSLLESYRTHALVITLRASPSFSFDKPSYRLLDAFVTSHSTATDLIKGGIGGRAGFLPDKYYEKVDPAFTGKPRDSIMFKIIVAEEGGEFRHTFGTNPIAPDVAWNTAVKRKPDPNWKETLMNFTKHLFKLEIQFYLCFCIDICAFCPTSHLRRLPLDGRK
ncbi:hypothetical protein RQP46_002013 [Phenoliferia psychrophenolica]